MKFFMLVLAVVLAVLSLTFHVKAKPEGKLNNQTPTRGEQHIFFVESSCVSSSSKDHALHLGLFLRHRQACAIESAARAHPNTSIYLFYTCPLNNNSLNISMQLVQRVFQYPNVHVWHESMENFFAGTPLEEFYRSGTLNKTIEGFRIAHASDVIRLLLLWKYGGIYLDLDFIVRRSLNSLGSNFVGTEDELHAGSSAIKLSFDDVGKKIAALCVKELRTNYRGDLWGHNGPDLITRVILRYCEVSKIELITRTQCRGFQVLPINVFYSITFREWLLFYDESVADVIMGRLEHSHAVHLWNSKMASDGYGKDDRALLLLVSKQPIVRLMQEFCPVVYFEQIQSGPDS